MAVVATDQRIWHGNETFLNDFSVGGSGSANRGSRIRSTSHPVWPKSQPTRNIESLLHHTLSRRDKRKRIGNTLFNQNG